MADVGTNLRAGKAYDAPRIRSFTQTFRYMREKIAQALAAHVINDADARRGASDGCSQTDLASLGAPRSVVHFLKRTLARRAQIEASEWFSGSFDWFDLSGDSVQAALDNLRHVVTDAARFPANEWPKAVHHAVDIMLDYLIDPVPTLLDFCFQGNSAVAVGDLRRRASYFREYPYVEQAVQAYSQKKGDKRVSRDDLQATLNHVLRQYTSDFSADDWMRTLEPLCEFVHVSGHVEGGLPVIFAVDFLSAHHRPGVAHVVEVEARMAKAEMISIHTLRHLVEEALAGAEAEPGAEAEAGDKTEPGAEAEAGDKTAPGDEADATATAEETPKPLWQQYAEQRGLHDVADRGAQSAPLWKSFQDRLETEARQAPIEPQASDVVREVLGEADRQANHFIDTLFGGDRDAFLGVMVRLQESPSWSKASTIVARDVFKRFDVDIYSDDAVAFTNAVESRYSR